MVKIVSLLVFIVSFVWTWNLFTTPNKMGIEIHAGIQSQLSELIEDTLKSRKPYVSNFKLLKMYTEKIDDQKIKAVFSYSFDEAQSETDSAGQTTQTISGEATLTKGLSETKGLQKWNIQSVKSDNQNLFFKDGSILKADGQTEAESSAENNEQSDTQKENK
ncbi:MAG: hypothetical protein ACK4VO_01705 [Pseudobdellovibrio sp.]